MPRTWLVRLAWMAVGVAFLYGVSAFAGAVSGGPLDPPYAPTAGTMKTIDAIAPSWFQILPSDDGAPCLNSRFYCVMNDQAVLDRETGLVWQRQAGGTAPNWFYAVSFCYSATTGDRYGWRLPTFAELSTLLDPPGTALASPSPFTDVLPGAANAYYYTTSTDPANNAYAHVIHINYPPMTILKPKANPSADLGGIWCVRAAESLSTD